MPVTQTTLQRRHSSLRSPHEDNSHNTDKRGNKSGSNPR
jgi:hypothetical protein